MLQFGYGNKYQRRPEHQKLWSASCDKGQARRSKYVPDVAVPFACIAPEQEIQAPHSKHQGERDGHVIEPEPPSSDSTPSARRVRRRGRDRCARRRRTGCVVMLTPGAPAAPGNCMSALVGLPPDRPESVSGTQAEQSHLGPPRGRSRSEERRVGKECRSRWSP